MGEKVEITSKPYLSLSCIEKLHLVDRETTPLVVAGDPRFRSGVILAACPMAKKEGVQTEEPLWQAQQKCPDLLLRKPQMQTYIVISLGICALLEETGAYLEPYSIDEFFLDTTDMIKHSSRTPFDLAYLLKKRIYRFTGLHARFGIGENKITAKLFDPTKDNIVQNSVMDTIKEKYGKDAIMYASFISGAGQVQRRSKKIGGHYK